MLWPVDGARAKMSFGENVRAPEKWGTNQGKTHQEIAKSAGVSHDTVYKVKAIKQKAPG
jgi:hypothetical protein